MDQGELNEVGTLLHIAETIITNHPKYSGIARACQKRLDEINQACIAAESLPRATQEYPKTVTPPEGPANSGIQREPGGPIERLSTDKRSEGEKLLDQPVEELPENGTVHTGAAPTVERRV